MRSVLAGLLLLASPALGATVTINPPAYTVDPPTFSTNPPPFTVNPPSFTITVPDGSGKQGPAGVAGPAGPQGVAGPPGPAGKDGAAGGAADLSGVLGRLDALERALAAGGTVTPPPVVLADPCAGRAGTWAALTLTPADNVEKALACAAPAFKLQLAAGTYAQHVWVPPGLDGWDAGPVPGALVKFDGKGGCPTATNNNDANACPNRLSRGKGVWFIQSAGTLHDVELTGGGDKATDGNGNPTHDGQAGFYLEIPNAGTMNIVRVMARGNQNGGFANGDNKAPLVISSSDFIRNGIDGGSHDLYISGGPSLTVRDSNFYGSLHGNNAKSRVSVVTVSGGYNRSGEGRWIEAADGSTMTITGGVYVGNSCCQNVFGNGTESTAKGPGNTTWRDSAIYIGPRSHNFSNAGKMDATNVSVICAPGGSIFNDKGTALSPGFVCGAANDNWMPAVPASASGIR